jgi:hypothetical protein
LDVEGQTVHTSLDARITDRYLRAEEFTAIAEASSRLTALATRPVVCALQGRH